VRRTLDLTGISEEVPAFADPEVAFNAASPPEA
jgi:hypothetical protein